MDTRDELEREVCVAVVDEAVRERDMAELAAGLRAAFAAAGVPRSRASGPHQLVHTQFLTELQESRAAAVNRAEAAERTAHDTADLMARAGDELRAEVATWKTRAEEAEREALEWKTRGDVWRDREETEHAARVTAERERDALRTERDQLAAKVTSLGTRETAERVLVRWYSGMAHGAKTAVEVFGASADRQVGLMVRAIAAELARDVPVPEQPGGLRVKYVFRDDGEMVVVPDDAQPAEPHVVRDIDREQLAAALRSYAAELGSEALFHAARILEGSRPAQPAVVSAERFEALVRALRVYMASGDGHGLTVALDALDAAKGGAR